MGGRGGRRTTGNVGRNNAGKRKKKKVPRIDFAIGSISRVRATPKDYVYDFVKVNLANIKRKLYSID
jgi:hypothetical protein